MPTDCIWHDARQEYEERRAGGCWFIEIEPYRSGLSKYYLENVASVRRPITVMIQSRRLEWVFPFIIDSHPSAEPDAHWDVTVDLASLIDGQKPNITVQPSIHAMEAYHGFLMAGVLSDDVG